MLLLVLCTGLLNLALGYALAVHWGYGPANLWEAWEAIMADRPTGVRRSAAGRSDQPPQAPGRPSEACPTVLEPGASPRMAGDDGALSGPTHPAQADDAEVPDLDPQHVETWVLKWSRAMVRSGLRIAEIESRLRASRGCGDSKIISKALADLEQDCVRSLDEQREVADGFRDRIAELGDLSALAEEIEINQLEMAAQLETTLGNLRQIEVGPDLEAAHQCLLDQIRNLRVVQHRMRDDHEAAFLAIASHHNRLDRLDRRFCVDALTRLPNRIGLETSLRAWWQEGRRHPRPSAAALFDLDRLGALDDQHGSLAADQLLCQLARLLETVVGETSLVARFAGQQFAVVMADSGHRDAAKTTETIRRAIAQATFLHGQEPVRLTASAGIAELAPHQTVEAVLPSLKQALAQAKRAGRNQSWRHNGREPEPVDPQGERRGELVGQSG